MQVKLTGKTKKGKERVKQHGAIWRITQSLGERVLIRSVQTDDWRWIWFEGENVDFDVEVLP